MLKKTLRPSRRGWGPKKNKKARPDVPVPPLDSIRSESPTPGVNALEPKQLDPLKLITDAKVVPVPVVLQEKKNTSWASVAWSIHLFIRGETGPGEAEFVANQGSSAAQTSYKADRATGIEQILGKQSKTDRLREPDTSGLFAKANISRELNVGRPLLARLGDNRFVVINGKRKYEAAYQLLIMDPQTGDCTWLETSNNTDHNKAFVDTAGDQVLSVLYYLNI